MDWSMMLNARKNYLELVRGIDLRDFERVRKMTRAPTSAKTPARTNSQPRANKWNGSCRMPSSSTYEP